MQLRDEHKQNIAGPKHACSVFARRAAKKAAKVEKLLRGVLEESHLPLDGVAVCEQHEFQFRRKKQKMRRNNLFFYLRQRTFFEARFP
ncbi:hypothetical protein GPALN_002216 [Globodera pallida]|nr:hypothetical protein GPALN_002216 [Globodera pallida]